MRYFVKKNSLLSSFLGVVGAIVFCSEARADELLLPPAYVNPTTTIGSPAIPAAPFEGQTNDSYDDYDAVDILADDPEYNAALASLAAAAGPEGIAPVDKLSERIKRLIRKIKLPPILRPPGNDAESRACKKIRQELDQARAQYDMLMRGVNQAAEEVRRLKEEINSAQREYNLAQKLYDLERVSGSSTERLAALRLQLTAKLHAIDKMKERLAEAEKRLNDEKGKLGQDVARLKQLIQDLERKYKESGCIKETPKTNPLQPQPDPIGGQSFEAPRPPFSDAEMLSTATEENLLMDVFFEITPPAGEVTPAGLLDPADAFSNPEP
jgi:hypothetical protein